MRRIKAEHKRESNRSETVVKQGSRVGVEGYACGFGRLRPSGTHGMSDSN